MEESADGLKEYESDSGSIESTQDSSFAKRKQDNKDKQDVKKLKKDKSKYKQPTADELNNFREVENLFNSVLLKSEVDELLLANTYDESKRTQKCSTFEKWFNTFSIGLKNIVQYGSVKACEFIKTVKKNNQKLSPVQLMINDIYEFTQDFAICDGNTNSCMVRPESVRTFGGYKSGGCLMRNFIPNIAVKMPQSAFYNKDFINNRYLVKRFHYLLYLMYELKNKPYISKIEIDNYQANALLKTLIITPDYDAKVRIRVFVVPERDAFKLSRMEPNQNNIKVNIYKDINLDRTNFSGRLFSDMNINNFTTKGTAMYNTLLLHDFTLEENNINIEKSLAEFVCYQEAIKLLLIWLKQRQFNTNYTSFTSELLIYTIVYLIQTKKINRHMSCYQVARVFFIFISESDWRIKPISLSEVTPDFTPFKNNFDVIFTDYSGFYNVAGFLHVAIYEKLKREAAMALEILTKDTCRAFLALFKTKMPVALQYDCIVYFNDQDYFQSLYKNFTSDEMKWKYFGFYEQLITNQFIELLKYGLGSRAECIVSLHLNGQQFNNCSPKGLKGESQQCFVFGLTLNPHDALNPIIIGPQQYDVEAAKFKDFWQDLVSLRRFPNTSIHETVYFDKAKTVADKRNICTEIVEFIANKLNVRFNVVSNQFDEVIRLPHLQLAFENGTNEEVTKMVGGITQELFKLVRNLTLPDVSIEMIQCVSDVYCGTDPFPPIPRNYNSGKKITTSKVDTILLREIKNVTLTPRYVQTIDCVMHIHLLNKYAIDNLEVYQATLAATYAAISKTLPTAPNLLSKETYSYVDVLYKGLVFRMRAYNDREVALLKRMLDDSGQVAYRSNDNSLSVDREGSIKPKLYGAFNGLFRQYPCFGAATALAKRWLRSQLLHYNHINDITVNLLMASVFLCPEPFDRPALPQVALLRFLRLLAEFPFDYLPVVINFNNELNKDEVSKFESEFLEKRRSYNAVHIITLYDNFNSVFTKKSPDCRILRRLKLMAVDALRYINAAVEKQELLCAQQLFTPNTEGFDLIININATLNSKRHLKVLHKIDKPILISEYDEKQDKKFPIVAFNPVDSYLRDLEQGYGIYAYFFHDIYGGDFIGVLWNREACQKNTDFKTSNVQGRVLADTDLVFDFDATISEFVALSQGLTKEVIENELQNLNTAIVK